jgi:putative serine protease PepD
MNHGEGMAHDETPWRPGDATERDVPPVPDRPPGAGAEPERAASPDNERSPASSIPSAETDAVSSASASCSSGSEPAESSESAEPSASGSSASEPDAADATPTEGAQAPDSAASPSGGSLTGGATYPTGDVSSADRPASAGSASSTDSSPSSPASGWEQRSPWAPSYPSVPSQGGQPRPQPYSIAQQPYSTAQQPYPGGQPYQPYPGGRPYSSAAGYSYPGATAAERLDAPTQRFPSQRPADAEQTGAQPSAGPAQGSSEHAGFGQQPAPPSPGRSRSRLVIGVVALALVTALVGGAVGGVLGYQVAAGGGQFSVLDSPLPGADASAVPSTAVEEVARRTLPAVVQLRVSSGQRSGAGSGMVLSQDGLILTNNHVIEAAAGGAGKIVVLFQNGRSASAEIIGRDPTSDIAVVRAQNVSGLVPITLGNSDSVRVGQQVVAIGSPLGLGGTVTTGIVSALNRAVSVGRDNDPSGQDAEVLNAIQTDAAINPGNSGGPLVDIEGRLIGINTAIASVGGTGDVGGSVGLGFSIPINQAKRVAEELQRNGQATKPVLGVQVQTQSRLAPLTDPPGAKVVAVTPPDGPAGQAGLRPGDVIVRVNDRTITTGDELVATVRSHAPGETLTLQLSDGRSASVVLRGEPVPASK